MINRRLASRFTHLQIERVLRAESIAELLAAQVDRSLKQALKKRQAADIADILAELPDRLTRIADTAFQRLATWSHREAVLVLVRTLPRRWFRAVSAATVLVGESHGAPAGQGGGFVAGRGGVAGWEKDDPLHFDNGVEPIIDKKLTDAEWAAWVQQHVFPAPDADTVQKIIEQDVKGKTWRERVNQLSRLIQPEVTALRLSEAFAEGRNVDEITRDLLPHITGGVRSSAQRIARTEGLRIANTMQREMYEDLGDLLAGIQILATLDERTRPEHALRNGRIHYTDRRRRPNVDTLPDLPDQPNCRCFDVPVMKLPEELKDDPNLAAQFQNAAGNAIPDPLEYQDWFRTADRPRRELAVGRRRYREMIKKLGREPQWSDFVKPDGTLMPLKELKSESDIERAIRLRYVQDAIAHRRQQILDVKAGGFELPAGPGRAKKPRKPVPGRVPRWAKPSTEVPFDPSLPAVFPAPDEISGGRRRRPADGSFRMPRLTRSYLRDVEQQTGLKLHRKQLRELKDDLREYSYSRMSEGGADAHRDEFDKDLKGQLIEEWEHETGQVWPRYQANIPKKNGESGYSRRKGDPYDAHHLIENQLGGPHTWWNIHPARFPDQHQGGIHGAGSPLRQLLAELGTH